MAPFCASFADFPALRHLTICPLILCGYRCPNPEPDRLRAHIPPNVETLCLCGENLIHVCTTPRDDVAVINEVRGIIADSTSLRCLVVEGGWGFNRPNDPNIALVQNEAAARGIRFRQGTHRTMFYGGKNTWIGGTTLPGAHQWVTFQWDETMAAQQVIPRGLRVQGFDGEL
ncbi:hypothetical protein BJY04DRAFT_194473 [Aspergillus karnatakaensis]|uniref:uncharacterized protein n=1 Tax=Aspergillus karnatakaensis TaxID=1810916 RepID=UPI003CCCFB16